MKKKNEIETTTRKVKNAIHKSTNIGLKKREREIKTQKIKFTNHNKQLERYKNSEVTDLQNRLVNNNKRGKRKTKTLILNESKNTEDCKKYKRQRKRLIVRRTTINYNLRSSQLERNKHELYKSHICQKLEIKTRNISKIKFQNPKVMIFNIMKFVM